MAASGARAKSLMPIRLEQGRRLAMFRRRLGSPTRRRASPQRCAGAESLYFTLTVFPHSPKRSEEHTSELQSLMRISYAVFCLKNKNRHTHQTYQYSSHL